MKIVTLVAMGALLTFAAAAPAFAQGAPPAAPSADIQQLRDGAKTAAMNDLSADHQSAVQAIVQKVDAGSLSVSDAATQIDALLTPDETKAVLGEAQKFHDAMRQAMASGGGPPGGGPPGGGHSGMHGKRTPDAGRFLVTVSASRDAMRQQQSAPPPP